MWEDPVHLGTGTNVDPDHWNVIVDDLLALSLHTHSGVAGDGAKLYTPKQFGSLYFVNTAATNTLWTEIVPANSLGTKGFYYGRAFALSFNQTGANKNVTWSLAYGAASVSVAALLSSGAGLRPCGIEFILANLGVTNSQNMIIFPKCGDKLADGNAGIANATDQTVWHAAAIDSTLDQTLTFSVAMATASPSASYQQLGGYIMGPFNL